VCLACGKCAESRRHFLTCPTVATDWMGDSGVPAERQVQLGRDILTCFREAISRCSTGTLKNEDYTSWDLTLAIKDVVANLSAPNVQDWYESYDVHVSTALRKLATPEIPESELRRATLPLDEDAFDRPATPPPAPPQPAPSVYSLYTPCAAALHAPNAVGPALQALPVPAFADLGAEAKHNMEVLLLEWLGERQVSHTPKPIKRKTIWGLSFTRSLLFFFFCVFRKWRCKR
jgi:hypothetical protein